MIDLKRVADLRVLMIGDAIVDEYVHVRVVGKSIKDNALSSMRMHSERFRGGAWAAAAHARNLCARVDVMVGDQMMWISRMVDAVYLHKLFVTHQVMPQNLQEAGEFDIAAYDVVVVADFGHGLMTQALIDRVTREARYLAVNAQTNATNYGFNPVTRYPRADLVVIDQLEARIAARDRDGPIEGVVEALGFGRVIVTLGADGILGYDGKFERRGAQADGVRDTMGAGDAVLAVTAPFAAVGAPMSDLLDVGNAAGAAKVGIVGHRQAVSADQLMHFMGRDDERTTG